MAQGAKKSARREEEGERYRREVAERIYEAFDRYNSGLPRSGKLSQADLGKMVAERRGLEKPIPQATVSSWMSENDPSTPDNLTLAAIADVLNTQPLWLILGVISD